VLRRVLEIAKTFRAVVLLDEADVFLEQRTSNNLERNALVSIFLRQIEYFAGIMFLTTNLVETFDQAFHSRIHISLAFSSLDIQAREQIWRNFARNMLEDLEIAEEEYTELARSDLNGRQIKNVFGSSKSLAADQGQLISMVHLRNVLQITTSFKM
jgi:SpoVK/Ycf46/Vps4 family AAA+-type ATPase